jgi:hypothetical protein
MPDGVQMLVTGKLPRGNPVPPIEYSDLVPSVS